jgi:murein DD-endopeptidase MepM/ murein hydrolase activator NlpD
LPALLIYMVSSIYSLAGCVAPQLPSPMSFSTAPMSSSTASDSRLPHAVLADDGAGRQLHLHVAPVVEGGRFVSGIGWRRHPLGGGGAYHRGLDVAAPSGTLVRAAASGEVVDVGRRGAFGRMVRIRHSVDLETLYAHLSRYAGYLAIGRKVRQDEVIGYVGASGRASGPHLHFEVRRNGVALDPLSLPPLPHGG